MLGQQTGDDVQLFPVRLHLSADIDGGLGGGVVQGVKAGVCCQAVDLRSGQDKERADTADQKQSSGYILVKYFFDIHDFFILRHKIGQKTQEKRSRGGWRQTLAADNNILMLKNIYQKQKVCKRTADTICAAEPRGVKSKTPEIRRFQVFYVVETTGLESAT